MSEIRDIVRSSRKIQDVIHDMQNWMKKDRHQNMCKLRNFVMECTKEEMDCRFAFILFCVCVDSLVASARSVSSVEWQSDLTELVSRCQPTDKEKITLDKVCVHVILIA